MKPTIPHSLTRSLTCIYIIMSYLFASTAHNGNNSKAEKRNDETKLNGVRLCELKQIEFIRKTTDWVWAQKKKNEQKQNIKGDSEKKTYMC